jgi:hypothetical protein
MGIAMIFTLLAHAEAVQPPATTAPAVSTAPEIAEIHIYVSTCNWDSRKQLDFPIVVECVAPPGSPVVGETTAFFPGGADYDSGKLLGSARDASKGVGQSRLIVSCELADAKGQRVPLRLRGQRLQRGCRLQAGSNFEKATMQEWMVRPAASMVLRAHLVTNGSIVSSDPIAIDIVGNNQGTGNDTGME